MEPGDQRGELDGGRLQSLRSGPPATPTARQDLAYTYDLTGNVATIMDAGAATVYGYDALDRLTTVAGQVRYSYDPTGNLLRKVEPDLSWDLTLTYTDTAHVHAPAVVSDPALGFGYELGYDANGNLIEAKSAAAGATDSFTWDAENRLAQRTTQQLVMQWYACPDLPDDPNPCVPGWRATWQTTGWDAYTRDADGNVLRRTDAAGEHLYIGGHYELHASAATSYYHFGDRRIALRAGTGSASYLLADHLGSTRVVEAGDDASTQHYTPWGEIAEGWNNTLPTEYTYTGQREASATGGLRLLDYGARSYWPFAGRFTAPDTIVPAPGDPQSLNRYAYARNNPLRYTDPTGHCSTCIGAVVGGLANAGLYLWNESRQPGGINLNIKVSLSNGLKVDVGDWGDLLVATGEGAVAGALIATPGTQALGISMAANLVGDHAGNLLTGDDFSASNHLISGATGLATAGTSVKAVGVIDKFVASKFVTNPAVTASLGKVLNAGFWGGVEGGLSGAAEGNFQWKDVAFGAGGNAAQEWMTIQWLDEIASTYGQAVADEVGTALYTELVAAGIIGAGSEIGVSFEEWLRTGRTWAEQHGGN